MVILRRYFAELPPHVSFIPADNDISTHSLFSLMDVCVTVRGTVGIEAARLGIPVITAGDGPYSDLGFTIDCRSREHYLSRLAQVQTIEPLTDHQQALAERFAFCHFLGRPLTLTTMGITYHETLAAHLAQGEVNITTPGDWSTAPDLRAIASCLICGARLDCYQCPDASDDGDRDEPRT